MSGDSGPTLAVEEFVEYCRTQARLLSGRVEQLRAEADEVLDDIEDEMADIRTRLDGHRTERTDAPPSAGRNERDIDVAAIEDLESSIEEKQALVDAKQARIRAFQELASGYVDLAGDLQSTVEDGEEAMHRVVRFEADHDAPAYFEDRQTVCEAAAEAGDSDES